MNHKLTKIFSSFFVIIFLFPGYLYAQLPGWVLTRDHDGNKYYIDSRGKIWTSGMPEYKYKPVSLAGIDYYLNQGIYLIKNHYIPDGLTILNSILAMPVTNNRIYKAQAKAAGEVNKLKKREGQRYSRHIEKSPLLLYHDEKSTVIENQISHYRMKIPCEITILNSSHRKKYRYLYHGLLAGLSFRQATNNRPEKFDALLALDSEEFKSIITSTAELKTHWEITLGDDTFSRGELYRERKMLLYTLEYSMSRPFSGYEGYFYNGNNGYFMRIIFSNSTMEKDREMMLNIMKGFKIL
jgi:hypothetical protein